MTAEDPKFRLAKPASEPPAVAETPAWGDELRRVLFGHRTILIATVLFALIFTRMGYDFFTREGLKPAVPNVEVAHPIVQAMDPSISLPGNIEAIEQASIYAHVSGYLKKLLVDEGDHVKQGQLLAVIDAPDISEDFNKAKAELNFKKVTRGRYDELLRQSVISQQEYDTVSADYEEAHARFQAAAANMGYTEIHAPFAGSIARRYKYPGDLISAANASSNQTPIFMLVNETTLRISINVPQSEVANVQLGNVVDIRVDTFPKDVFPGKVSRVDALMEEATKTQRVLIDIDNPEHQLHAGMFATVTLHFNHVTAKSAVTVPENALHSEEDLTYVYVTANDIAHRVPIKTGLNKDGLIEVPSGLKANDLIIIKGAEGLKDGDHVHATLVTGAKIASAVAPSAPPAPAKNRE